MRTAKIEAIIFDYGDVIFDLDFSKAKKAFTDLGVPNVDQFYGHLQQFELFDDFDKGHLTAAEFRDVIRERVALDLTDAEIDEAFNALLVGIPAGRHELLLAMKEQYRTFLLSNNNEIHYPAIMKYIKKNYDLDHYDDFFEAAYFSHFMGMRKPDAEIFQWVLDQHNLDPSTTLFLDDSPQHIATAQSLGLQTVLISKEFPLERVLKNLGL